MIYVRIELWPKGSGPAKVLGEMTITNDGSGTEQDGNYTVKLSKFGGFVSRDDQPSLFAGLAERLRCIEPKSTSVWKRGRVLGFDRIKRGPFDLLLLALEQVVGERR